MKIQKKNRAGGGGVGGRVSGGGQGRCERRSKVFCEKSKTNIYWGWCSGRGARVGGIRSDVNEELSFVCEKIKKNRVGGGGSG